MSRSLALNPLLCVLAGGVAAAPLAAQESASRPASAEACRAIASDATRLACYDAVHGYNALSTEHADEIARQAQQQARQDKAEQRAAVAERRAIPLAQAVKTLHAHGRRAELVRARLCRHGEGLAYMLTLLARSGKVTRVAVDAANGEVINGR